MPAPSIEVIMPLRPLLQLGLWFAFLMVVPLATAQSPRPLQSPNIDIWAAGTVDIIAPTPLISAIAAAADGSVFVGGRFSSVNGVTRTSLVKLNASGDVDTNWNAAIGSGSVNNLLLAGTALIASGNFSTVGGQPKDGMANLSATGTGAVDSLWAPQLSFQPSAMRFDGNGFVYVNRGADPFDQVRRVALAGSGVIDPTWAPDIDGPVQNMDFDGLGNLVIGGNFSTVQGSSRARVAKQSLAAGAAVSEQDGTPSSARTNLAEHWRGSSSTR